MAKKANAVKRGTVEAFKSSQAIKYVGLFQAGDHKLRINAEYDSYKGQSWAAIERWNGSEWKEIYTLRGGSLKGWQEGIAYKPGAAQELTFAADVAFLLDRAAEVLGF